MGSFLEKQCLSYLNLDLPRSQGPVPSNLDHCVYCVRDGCVYPCSQPEGVSTAAERSLWLDSWIPTPRAAPKPRGYSTTRSCYGSHCAYHHLCQTFTTRVSIFGGHRHHLCLNSHVPIIHVFSSIFLINVLTTSLPPLPHRHCLSNNLPTIFSLLTPDGSSWRRKHSGNVALHPLDSQGPTCAGTEPISEARSGSMCSPLPGGKGLLGLAGPSRDIADAVLAGDTPDQ